MTIKEKIVIAYLDYVNNFLTVSKFAEHHEITEAEASIIIDAGRELNNI